MKNLYEFVAQHPKIYSLLYSPHRVDSLPLEKQIEEIPVSKLIWNKDLQGFWYVWGGPPRPDVNRYDLSTYGKGWAFTKEEIIDTWANK